MRSRREKPGISREGRRAIEIRFRSPLQAVEDVERISLLRVIVLGVALLSRDRRTRRSAEILVRNFHLFGRVDAGHETVR